MAACPHCQHQPLRARIRAWWGRNASLLGGLVVLGVLLLGGTLYLRFGTFYCVIPKGHTTRSKLKSVENALRQYSIDNGYPTQGQGLAVLVDPPGGEKPYLEAFPRDAWNRPIVYVAPDTLKERECRSGKDLPPFIVFSKGEDGKEGTEDDITSKRRRT
jgi:type II secretion system protein G